MSLDAAVIEPESQDSSWLRFLHSWKVKSAWLLVMLMFLLSASFYALLVGAFKIDSDALLAWLMGNTILVDQRMVLEEIRFPRILLGVLVGSSLAVAGAVMQGLFRNPLADPGLIGIASGAALGAIVWIVLASYFPWLAALKLIFGGYTLPMMAFVGGMLVTLLVFSMGSAGGGRDTTVQLLLAGLAINAIAGAVAGLLTYIADDQQLRSITFWQMGSLGGIGWSDLTMMSSIMIPATLLLWLLAKPLDAILLGESVAMHMGVSVAQVRIAIIVLGALLVGAAVAMSGMVGFVGLMAPHMARMQLGESHRWLLPGSALIGALLVSFADILSRTLVAPAEIPIGLVTAAMGSPFFLYLLYRRRVL